MTTYVGNPPKSVYGVKDATNLLYDYTVPTATTEIILEGIFGDHESFTVEIDSKYTGTGNSMYFNVNDDATNANYRYHDHYLETVTPTNSQGHGANPYLGWFTRTCYYTAKMDFRLVPDLAGNKTVMVRNSVRQIGTASPYEGTIVDTTGRHVVGITSLNKLRIWLDGTTKLPAGTRVRVYSKEATNLVLPLEYSAPRKNYLINPNFAINQRGYVSGTALAAGTYGFDRWRSDGSIANNTHTLSGDVMTIDNTVASTDGSLVQPIEEGTLLAGEYYTLSWEGTAQASLWYANGSATSFQDSPLIFIAPAGAVANVQDFVIFRGDGVTVSKPKLERGRSVTPYDPPQFATEFTKCQRYYETCYTSAREQSVSSGNFGSHIAFKATKAKTPTMTNINMGTTAIGCTFNNFYGITTEGAGFQANITAGTHYYYGAKNIADAEI